MTTSLFLALSRLEEIPPVLLAPFCLLLLLFAVMPLTPPRVKHWWEHNYHFVCVILALIVGGYYVLQVPAGTRTLGHALHEYFSFITMIGSLFVVAGGIHVRVKSEATPLENVAFLAVGAVLANLIGTTGASVVLIRPWIRMNKLRVRAFHIVFFIFLVSNVGGSLTPIGDPPLFLGFLRGVPFFWLVQHLWLEWLATVLLILAVFYAFDRWSYRRRQVPANGVGASHRDTFLLEGKRNLLLLVVVVAAVFLPANYFIRELAMLAGAGLSLKFTPRQIHAHNQFNFHPIKEVAFLFLGVFTTMMPALNYLEVHGSKLGFTQPSQYYFATGGLSAVLDNAPTYVNFLKLAETTFVEKSQVEEDEGGDSYDRRAVAVLVKTQPAIVIAISLGAVFFGAMTYIGNGPNFMVKSIAQGAGVNCPGFFGYIVKYSLPILLPILALSAWLFL